ncbi:tRNA (adenosine(37)-N6)-threonylcarbamoyltransferase complex ATPase subunit type 1 TsaE [Nakamurella aerolata]|uniref:tRNA (adenosine(37)-N6)-threonylcarbamoyltransferase complex ATPase subunit type 1 TsaE n=1 Tax=Nakamurella aerolata TaxID=1656892 RepID=UPI0031B62070
MSEHLDGLERTVTVRVASPEQTLRLGREIGALLRAGDVVLLSGELGAGKTTITKGIADGMGITDTITSPTFVLARVHNGPRLPLVHVDAYRLSGAMELDDLDLDTDLARAAVVVEWGEDIAADLATDPLHLKLFRDDADENSRRVEIRWTDPRWAVLATQPSS